MTITRNIHGIGATIELTEKEIEEAYRERRDYYDRVDIISKLCNMLDVEDFESIDEDKYYEFSTRTIHGKTIKALVTDEDFISNVVSSFEEGLSNNDSYWESYWMTAEDAIEDELDEEVPKTELEIKHDENKIKYRELISSINFSKLSFRSKAELINLIINEGVT